MTTIAWDGKKLVGDRRVTTDGFFDTAEMEKIFIVPEGYKWKLHGEEIIAYAFAGDTDVGRMLDPELIGEVCDDLGQVLTHHFHNTFTELCDAPDYPCFLIFINSKGKGSKTSLFSENIGGEIVRRIRHFPPVDGPLSIGSGGNFAKGCLAIGLDAEMSVVLTSNYDETTGSSVNIWEFSRPKEIAFKDWRGMEDLLREKASNAISK